MVAAVDPLPYVQHHITVNKCVECVVKIKHFLPSVLQNKPISITVFVRLNS